MASASKPLLLGAFQRERHYRAVEHRYRRMARMASLAAVFADFETLAEGGDGPTEVPIASDAAIGHEWAVVVDAAGFSVCLAAWEPPVADPPANELDRDGVLTIFTTWHLYALVVVGYGSMTLNQLALNTGALAAAVATSMAFDPITSVVLGVTLLGESLDTGALDIVATVAALAAAGAGMAVLARQQSQAQVPPEASRSPA